ncbi:MAG: hypothetical protein K2Y71_06345 [Xanthobacteraceae bacterium]|nr:hypothetical protein [Xanthobacteraceae bacterium]
MTMPPAATSIARSPCIALILSASLLFAFGLSRMFRKWLFDGFDGVLGDQGDARLIIAVLEHWYRVYSGNWSDWLNPPFLHPERGVLGFTDAYLLYGVVYTPLRLAGADPFTAFMLVMAALSAIGFFGFMRLATADFGVSAGSAAVGAFLFAFANMMIVKVGHPQSYCAMVLPLVCHLTASAFKAERRRPAIVAAAAAGLLHGLIFATAWFTGWFATLFAIIALLTFAALRGADLKQDAAYVISTKRHVLAAWIAGFAIGIVPFLTIHGPVWLQGHRRDFSEVLHFAPAFSDIVNLGHSSWMYRSLMLSTGIIGPPERRFGEFELGFTPGVLIVVIGMMIMLLRSWIRPASRAVETRTVTVIALALALFVCWLLQLNYFGLRPWYAIWALVPGAAAVRTAFRFQIVLNLAAALLVALALDRIRLELRRGPLVAALLAGFLIVEQINRGPVSFSRAEQLAWLQRVPPPPAHCRAFYLAPGVLPTGVSAVAIQSDAMLVAVRFGIPTLNGSSGVFPGEWRLHDPSAPDYVHALRDWSTRHGLAAGLCGLQSRAGAWIDHPP